MTIKIHKMGFFDELQQVTSAERDYLLAAPIIQQAIAGTVSQASYVAFLSQAYHHVKHTTPLLMACGARLPERLEWLREAVAEYIEEELGHQEWVLNDIRACGADAPVPAPPDWRVTALNDQHAYLRFPTHAAVVPQVGDRVALGISHPCTTFDKWRWMAVVNEACDVVDAVVTCF